MSETGSGSLKQACVEDYPAPSSITPLDESQPIPEENITASDPKTDDHDDVNTATATSNKVEEVERSVVNTNKSDNEESTQDLVNATTEIETKQFEEKSTIVVSLELNESSTFCNDLVNLASDKSNKKEDEEDEQHEDEESADKKDDKAELETDEGTCSRSRPYIRHPRAKLDLNDKVSSKVPLLKMPTPPEEGTDEDDDASKKLICHFTPTPTIPSSISLKVKENKVMDSLESSKTELALDYCVKTSVNSNSTKIVQSELSDQSDNISESGNAKCGLSGDSSSADSETSQKPPASNEDPVKTVQNPHSPSSNSVPFGAGHDDHDLQKSNGPKSDHKDKRLLSLSPATKTTAGQHQNQHHHHHQQHGTTSTKKGSKIPVGIAVAWQRLVTSNSSLQNSSSSVSTVSCAPSNKVTEMPKPNKEKVQLHKTPVRPSSASPSQISVHATPGHKIKEDFNTKSPSYSAKRNSVLTEGGPICDVSAKRTILDMTSKSVTSELTAGCRPLPSSSVPPNLGLSYFPQQSAPSLLDYHYGNMRSLTPFPSHHSSTQQHSHFHSLPPTWQNQHLGMISDLNVPQGFPSAGAYIQQTMQNQLQFQQHFAQQYNNFAGGSSVSSSLMPNHSHYLSQSSVGYENTLRHHYEQLFQQQQQSEYLRHFHQQQQQHHQSQLGHQLLLSSAAGGGMYSSVNDGIRSYPTTFPPTPTTRIPLLSPSPTGGVRTPTPNSGYNPSQSSHSLSLSNLSAISPAGPQQTTTTTAPPLNASWSAELFHRNSSTALSPKSLTSSSPSPVTVQQTYQDQGSLIVNTIAGGGSGCGNSEKTITTFIGSKCAPSTNLVKALPPNVWEDVSALSTKTQVKHKHLSVSSDKDQDDRRDQTNMDENPQRKLQGDDLNLHRSVSKSLSLPVNHKPDRHMRNGKDGNGKLIIDVSDTSADKTGSITKHDFKRLDSLIEKRDLEGNNNEIEDLTTKPRNEVSPCNFDKSGLGGEGIKKKPVKVETNPDTHISAAMDLKQCIVSPPQPPPTLLKNVEIDLNQNLKLMSSPLLATPLIVSSTKATLAKTSNKVKPVNDNAKANKITAKQSRTLKIKSSQNPNENKQKDSSNKPTNYNRATVKAARRPCKIKPDINVSNRKDNNNHTTGECLQFKKQPKLKVYKSKKTKEQESNGQLSSCDPPLLDTICTSKGNNVPELNLPVAITSCDSFNNNSDTNSCAGNKDNVGLSPVRNNPKKSSTSPKKVKDDSSKSLKRKSNDAKPEKVKKVKVKVEKVKVIKQEKRKPIAIKSKGSVIVTTSSSTPSSSSSTAATVILTTPNHPTIAFPGSSNGPMDLNHPVQATLQSSPNSGESCSVVQSSPMIPISLPYHHSPVTLILPRLLPQTTITNSHQQTSFKLVVSSQEIKIPAFVPSQSGLATIEGTSHMQTFHLHHQEQNFQNIASNSFSSFHNQNIMRTAVTTNAPCDTDNVVSSDNTITFIRHTPMSPSHQNSHSEGMMRHFPQPVLHHPQHHQTSSNCYLSPPTRKENFVPSEDNHLNLLATVAQEFGSRDDLGKLASHSNSSRGSSLMTSPILSLQSPELNFPTPSSTISSNASTGSNNTATTSISLPSSPLLNAKFASKSPNHDEYEYDERELGTNEMSLGSYKHPFCLKIPTIIPTAANTAAAKKRKQQNKAIPKKMLGGEKPPKKQKMKKEKKSTGANNSHNTHKNTTKEINGENSTTASKLKIPKVSLMKFKTEGKEISSKAISSRKMKQDMPPSSQPTSVKIKLPVPKVGKLRIKLSETENPTLMNHKKQTINSYANGDLKKEQKVKRRHSDGDGMKPRNYIKREKERKSLHKKANPKNYHNYDKDTVRISSTAERAKKNKSRPIAVDTATDSRSEQMKSSTSAGDVFVSSFTSLTPPPTATLGVGVIPTASSSRMPSSIFSTSSFEYQQQISEKSGYDKGNEGRDMTNRKPNWVCDPTFAASAIRVSGINVTKNPPIKTEKVSVLPLAGLSSDEDEDLILREYERRSAEPMRDEKKPSIIPANLFEDKVSNSYPNDSSQQVDLKAFVPYTTSNKRANKHQTRHTLQQQHHIKPCLKAEPRPRSSEEEEHSDSEIDLEVASLTNSIPRSHTTTSTTMVQQYRNSQKVAGDSKSVKTAIKNEKMRTSTRRLSSNTSKKQKSVVGRRLSLNLETGRTHAHERGVDHDSDEELLDIGGDYSTNSAYNHRHHHSTHHNHHHGRRQSASNAKTSHRRFSGGSASTSASFGSSFTKQLPKKRGSRSLTTSSRSSVSSVVASGFSTVSRSRSRRESTTMNVPITDVHMEETLLPGQIEIGTVEELKNEMRILTEIQGLHYTGKLNAISAPDVYGVTLDNERGAPPHIIFSAEEVLEKCVREKKPRTLTVGLRICAYWSPQYSGLYPGRVSIDFNPSFNPETELVPIEFDDGDTGMIKLSEIRLLPGHHPMRAYDPNPLLTLEKKHKKRRSSANTNAMCTGDHAEADCGEPYCAKVAKLDEDEKEEDDEDDDEIMGSKRPWTWTGLGYKRSKAKNSRNKEFFRGIQRGDEVINVGDSVILISHGNERPYIGRIEKFWEKKNQKIVNVRWFYHPEEVKSPKRIPHLKHTGALFESPHIDENDVQTIARKCEVLPYKEFKERLGRQALPRLSIKNSSNSTKPKDLYYVAGFYDPSLKTLSMINDLN